MRLAQRERTFFWTPIMLALLAAVGTQSFRMSCQASPRLMYVEWVATAIAALVMWWLLVWFPDRTSPRLAVRPKHLAATVLGSVLLIIPVGFQWYARACDAGDAYEIVVLTVVQNGALVAAVSARDLRSSAISVILSAFQLLFVSFIYPTVLSYTLMGVGTVAVLWWLMGNYWQRIECHQAVRRTTRVPLRGVVILGTAGVIAVSVLVTLPLVPQSVWEQIAGWIPFSGGDRWGDLYARDGVGKGEILTGARDRADIIGPVETNLYLSSQQPSLYDMISRAYGPPSKRHERRIDIDGDDQTHQHEQTTFMAAAREFSTHRRPRDRKVNEAGRQSVAMLFYEGRVPAHLRLQTFDTFDGVTWHLVNSAEPPQLFLHYRQGQPWIGVYSPWSRKADQSTWRGVVAIVNLKTDRLPLSALPAAWHLARVDRLDFFGWTSDDLPQMRGRDEVPPLVPIHYDAVQVRHRELRFDNERSYARSATMANAEGPSCSAHDREGDPSMPIGPATMAEIERLRATGLTGIKLVEQIEALLRGEFVCADEHVPPDDCGDTVEWFLTERRGPDYLFASAAAALLRGTGFDVRLVQGFYLDRRHYDAKARKYVAWGNDVHTWVEVRCADGSWIPVEPTPGYALPPRLLSPAQWAWMVVETIGKWIGQRWLFLVVLLAVVWWGYRARVQLVGAFLRGLWPLVRNLPVRAQIRWGCWVIHWRWRMVGRRRHPHETWRTWLQRVAADGETGAPATVWTDWLDLCERYYYGHEQSLATASLARSRHICGAAIRAAFDVTSSSRARERSKNTHAQSHRPTRFNTE